MVPWAQEDTRHLLRFGEEEFNQALDKLGDLSYIGTGSTFGFLHIFAFMRASLSLFILLDRGADIHATTDIGANLLHVAAAGGDESLVQILCEKRVFEINSTVDGGKRLTALILAARMGHVPVILKLLENGADVNDRDRDGITALMYAAGRGHVDAVQRLIEKSAKTQARDNNASTALHHAAAGNHVEVIAKLLKNGAEINAVDSDGYSSLFRAVVKGNSEAVENLLSHGADCNLRTTTGWSAVGAAAVEKRLDMLKLLMMRGWQRDASVDPKGRDLFSFAVEERLNEVKKRYGEVEQLRQRRPQTVFLRSSAPTDKSLRHLLPGFATAKSKNGTRGM
jgi:ankyrin repeat protein